MAIIAKYWWKGLCVILLIYTIIAGFLMPSPPLPILHESIRNLYFHVPMWFGMTIMLLASCYYSLRFLSKNILNWDIYAAASARVGLFMGILGILTGMEWARTTWGAWWTNDPKLMGSAVGLLIYLAYFVLRNSIDDIDRRAKVSAVFNIMAFAIFIPAIYIVPRLTDSLHPGNGGNPGFSAYDLDGNMRLVFYPAVIGWILLGAWMASLAARIKIIETRIKAGEDIFHSTTPHTEVVDSL